MENTSWFFNKYIDTADELIRFQLSPSIFKIVYTDHLQALLYYATMQCYMFILFDCRFDVP